MKSIYKSCLNGKLKLVSILLLFSLFSLSSCYDHNPEEVKIVDDLMILQDSLQKSIVEFDMHYAELVIEESAALLKQIEEIEVNESNKSDYLNWISMIGDINKTLKRGIPKCLMLQKVLNESELQLTSLKHDLKRDLIEDSLVKVYLYDEKDILNQLEFQVGGCMNLMKDKVLLYEDKEANIKEFINTNSK